MLFLAAWGVFLGLSPFRRAGGDSNEMVMYVEGGTDFYYYRSPFTLFLHRAAYDALRPFGFDGERAIALCSSAAGGAYLLALLAICRHPLFLAFNLLAGTTFLFLGHIENYAWVNALLVAYFAFVQRHFARAAPLWPAAATLFLACLFHMLAVFTLPTLLFLLFRWDGAARRIRRRIPDDDFEMILLAFVGAVIIVVFGPLAWPAAGLDNNLQRFVPLFHNPNPQRYYFTMLASDHLRMLAYFHWKASPLGLIALLALGRRIRGPFQRFLLGATACGLAWTTVWHPDMHKGDWDLFSSFAFPLNVLIGLLLAGLWEDFRARRADAGKFPPAKTSNRLTPMGGLDSNGGS